MKIFLRIIIVILILVVLLVLALFGVRWFNDNKYGWSDSENFDLHDMSNYPSNVRGVSIEQFESGHANGMHFVPDEPINDEVIVTFGGSEGSNNFSLALMLAQKGYEVYGLFFFGAENQTEDLNMVPLEFFQDFIDAQDLVDEEVTLIGASKGAELSLLLTNYYDNINNLVLISPSEYVYAGLTFGRDASSSWSYDGDAIPYVDFQDGDISQLFKMFFDMAVLNPVVYRDSYVSAAENSSDQKIIDVDNIDGQVLLIAGDDDQVWQGEVAAERLAEKIGDNAEVIIYEGVGHMPGLPATLSGMLMGGNTRDNIEAGFDMNERILEFLEEHLD